MSETGRVCAVSGNQITLGREGIEGDSCFGCLKTECKNPKRFITLENSPNFSLKNGDVVEIKADPVAIFVQAASALGLPALGFLAGFFLTGLLFPEAREPAKAAAGVLLMFATAFGLLRLRRRYPAKNPFRITGPQIPAKDPQSVFGNTEDLF